MDGQRVLITGAWRRISAGSTNDGCDGVHHTCTTREGQTRSTTVTHGDTEMPVDLRKYTNVLISELRRFTFAT